MTGGRARDIVGTLDFLVELTAQARGWRIARVRAAAPIDDAQRTELADSLGALAGAPVELQVEVDESLLSGALIRIGDLQVDATDGGGSTPCVSISPRPAGSPPGSAGGQSSQDQTEGAE